MKTFILIITFAVVLCSAINADENTPLETVAVKPHADQPKPDRWLMLCCGLPGDDDHRERLTEACRKIIAASPVLGVSPEKMRVLAGDEQMQEALSATGPEVGICTQKTIKDGLLKLAEDVPADGACWVVMLGHAHLYGNRSQYNVLDTDFDQKQFGEWAGTIKCREQVFIVTMPISGFWLKPLRAPSRVVITATEADLEYTGTEMPYALADVLAGDGEHATLEDVDQDGAVSLLDLYLASNLEIHGRFKAMDRLQTEHALLDDNGDGRGNELQLPYIPPEEEESEEDSEDDGEETEGDDAQSDGKEPVIDLPRPVNSPNLDGYRARHILLIPEASK